ncbi:MAG: response regulator [Gemmatimonadota bacterium]|nr:response regulator [Gemmatimonadota bacterium]
MHVLLVDDHDFTRALHKKVLTDLGVQAITEARDGNEALAAARARRPDIVITDLSMPGMDGMTFVNHLAQERLADSVVIASGLAPGVLKAVEAMAVAQGLRVLGAIEKPLRKDALASMLYLHAHPADIGVSGVLPLDAAAVERAVELGQFKAWFSPVLDVSLMRVVAADVVPRWESPERGVLMGDAELAPVLALPAAAAVERSIVQGALSAGGLWRQMGWDGVVTLPPGMAFVSDQSLWNDMPLMIRKHGASGSVALALDASLLVRDAARGALAAARALMDGYHVDVRLHEVADCDALMHVAACSVVTCPAAWVVAEGAAAERAALRRVQDFAARMGAELGVSGVDDATLLGRLASAGVRRAQGSAVGRSATAAETYDTHLARR